MLADNPDPAARTWLIVGSAAAGLLLIVLVALLTQHDAPGAARVGAPGLPDPSAAAGAVRASRASSDGSDASEAPIGFGSSAPGEKFIQAFQQQVTQELHATLDSARHDQETQLRLSEQRQREQAAEQLETIQRMVAELHNPVPDAALAGGASAFEAPRIHARAARERGAMLAGSGDGDAGGGADNAQGTATAFGLDPSDIRALESGAGDSAPARISVGLAPRDGPRPGAPNIAPHGFVEGQLLNGVVAVVGGPERESIVALSGPYQAANGFETNLDGCFALVQGRPEAAAGRIDFKVSRLTCNFDDGASKTWDVAGWLVDGDGIRGLRATIVQNLDKKAAVAALGGAVGGIGRRLSQQQYQSSAAPYGGTSSNFDGNAARDAAGGAAEGAANAIQQSVGEYYQLFAPSLQVGGGTAVTVVIANELALPPSGRGTTTTHTAIP
jgi:conjugal transfer pilus assembly protein TraB